MPAKRSAMRKIKDVLRLKFEARLSHEKIAAATGMSKGAVTNTVQRAAEKGLSWSLPADVHGGGCVGRVAIDTNLAENAIRPFALGRRNWLFADSTKGAKASAAWYSLVETAKANGLEPYAYLWRLFERLPQAKTVEDFEALLPFSTFDLSPQ